MLQGKIIINTQPNGFEDPIGDALKKIGATVISMPLIEIIPVTVAKETLTDIVQNNIYQWLVFTSNNGVDVLFNQLDSLLEKVALPFKTAVFGKRTAMALKNRGWNPDLENRQNSAGDLLNDLLPILETGEKVLLVLGNLASGMMQEKLRTKVKVDRLNVYCTVFVQAIDEEMVQKIIRNEYDLLLFTSPSGVASFRHHTIGKVQISQLKTAALGPTTEKALLAEGVTPLIVAKPSGKEGLLKGLEQYFSTANDF